MQRGNSYALTRVATAQFAQNNFGLKGLAAPGPTPPLLVWQLHQDLTSNALKKDNVTPLLYGFPER